MEFKKIFSVLIIIGLLFSLSGCSDDDSSIGPQPVNTLKIGALLPMTGQYSAQGTCFLSALRFAVEDVNADFESSGSSSRVELIWADTQTDPTAAQSLIGSYINQNIRLVVGPVTSSEVLGIRDRVNDANCILLSPSSTMIELEVANDHIFRLVPSDSEIVKAISDVMWSDGIRDVITFYEDGEWGSSISTNLKETFEGKGGTCVGTVDHFSIRQSILSESIDSLHNMVASYAEDNSLSELAIHFTSFDEGTLLFEMMSDDTLLSSVKWYGSDGFVNNVHLLENEDAREFAVKVEYTAPIFGFEENQSYSELISRVIDETNIEPGVYPIIAYDALTVAAKTLDETLDDDTNDQIAVKLREVISDHTGLTGAIPLNDYDDRANGSYFFWKVVQNGNEYEWQHVSTYTDGVIE